jgi:hypothetical protein
LGDEEEGIAHHPALVADDPRCEVLGCGPSIAIELGGHAFLPEPGSDEAVRCLHPIAAKPPEAGGTVNRAKDYDGLTGPSPAGTIQSG